MSGALDSRVLGSLFDLASGDESFVDELLEIYLSQANEIVYGLRLALLAGDQVAVRRSGHALMGASLNIGALTVAEVCREIEDGHGGRASTKSDLVRLETELARVRDAVVERESLTSSSCEDVTARIVDLR